jgi:hypothetical protein
MGEVPCPFKHCGERVGLSSEGNHKFIKNGFFFLKIHLQ